MALTIAAVIPEYVRTSEYFEGMRVETADVPTDRYGNADPNGIYRIFQTFTDADTSRFRYTLAQMGVNYRPFEH